MSYTYEHIGTISHGIDGHDEYVLVTRTTKNYEPLDLADVEATVTEGTYSDSGVAGGYFCHRVTICPNPISDWQAVAIIHHRFDV